MASTTPPSRLDFLDTGDAALSRPSSTRPSYPEPQESPPAVNFLATVTRLIKSGELSAFISKGIYPSPLHEALSELQRKAETALAFPLLDKAAKESKDSEMRLMYVTGYNIACWFEQRMRMSYKPVKPVQNETFEYVDPEGNYKLLIEEVLQNRDAKTYTTCWKAWGKGWSLEYEMTPKIKFSILTGPCLEFNSNCIGEIRFAEGDCYSTTLAPGLVTSLASNPQVFSYKGIAYVTNVGTGLRSETDLSEPSMLSLGKKHQVKGILTQKGKKASNLQLSGKWDEQFVVGEKGGKEVVIWQRDTSPRPACRYSLTALAVQLNSLTEELAEILPPTDSRLRPDVRAVEQGSYSKADEELKEVSAQNEQSFSRGEDLKCKGLWFGPAPEGSYLKHRYLGGYWEARESKAKGNAAAWSGCPNIFALGGK